MQPWSNLKCEPSVAWNASPKEKAYVTSGKFDENAVTITLANEVKELVADFEYASANGLRADLWYFKVKKATAETRPLGTSKMKRLVTRGKEPKKLARRRGPRSLVARGDGVGEEWKLLVGYHCAPEADTCLYDLYINEDESWTGLGLPCQLHVKRMGDYEINRTPWAGVKCDPLGDNQVYLIDGKFETDGHNMVISVANKERRLVADFGFDAGQVGGMKMRAWGHWGSETQAKTRSMEPDTKRLRRREEEEATSDYALWYLNGGIFRRCEGNTCDYHTYIYRPEDGDEGEPLQKRCSFTVTATGDNAAIDEPFNAVSCDEPDAQEYLIWGSGPVLEEEVASGLVLKIFLADQVQGWIAVFGAYPEHMYADTTYSEYSPSGYAIPWGGETSEGEAPAEGEAPPAEGEVPAEVEVPAEDETPPEGEAEWTEGTAEGTSEASPAKRAAKRDSEAENKSEWRLHDV